MREQIYAKYVRELKFNKDTVVMHPENSRPDVLPVIPKSITIDGKNWPVATKHLEVFLISEPCGSGIERAIDPAKPVFELLPGMFAEDDVESALFDGNGGETHYHRHEETYIFCGTNPDDPEDLGGEIELWLGIGKNAEKFIITKSTAVLMPPGLAAHPLIFRRVDRPIVKIVIYDNPIYSIIPVGINPPDFKP